MLELNLFLLKIRLFKEGGNVNESIDHEPFHLSCRAYAREPTHPDVSSEQTHDACDWLNEEDGEQDVLWGRTGGNRRSRAPSVAQHEGRNAGGQDDQRAENRARD